MSDAEKYKAYEAGSDELVTILVEEHHGWAASIARSVARAWNLDWQLDGLDGGAYEGLVFCARRYNPEMGVPFRAYARRRIHEAATEEARQSKTWKKSVGSGTPEEQEAREISAKLFDVFPELREGLLPQNDEEGEESVRIAIRTMLTGATMIQAFEQSGAENPQTAAEYKEMLVLVSDLEPIHQFILYSIYWKGQSMRSLAEEWDIDELTIIREHKEIINHIFGFLSEDVIRPKKKLKIRPGLRPKAQQLRKTNAQPPFARFATSALVLIAPLGFVLTLLRL